MTKQNTKKQDNIGFDPYTFVSLVGRVVVEQDGKLEFIIRNGMKHEYWLDG